MTPTVNVGTILIEEQPLITKFLGLESDPCSGRWSVVRGLDGFALDHKIHAAGWNFFFMAAEIRVRFFGAAGAKKIQNAVTRILQKVRPQHFNGLEVTGIAARRFLGVPYTIVSAHSRHIQQSCQLNSTLARSRAHRDAEWANG